MIVGIDLSLRSTGLAKIVGNVVTTERIRPKMTGHERLELIEGRIAEYVADASLVVMEGISLASFDQAKALAGCWWIVRHRLWEEGIPVGVMPPQTRAKYATGKGSAKKAEVIAAVNGPRFPFAQAEDDDTADAIVLAHAGARWLGRPLDTVGAAQQACVLRCEWPVLRPLP